MAPWVKCWPCKHRDPSSDPLIHVNVGVGHLVTLLQSQGVGGRDGDPLSQLAS